MNRPTALSLGNMFSFGGGLNRPECVLVTRRGATHVSDARRGVLTIGPDGSKSYTANRGVLANGIALTPDGAFLAANMNEAGGVWRLTADDARPFLMEVEGQALGSVNFVLLDRFKRVWISVSASNAIRGEYSSTQTDGRLILVDGGGARTVAEGLCWANECRIDGLGTTLFVNETFARRVTAFTIGENGALSQPRVVAEFGPGVFPDGLALDVEGGVWIASVISNRLIRIASGGEQTVLLEDPDPRLDEYEAHYLAGTLRRRDLQQARGARLRNISSVAFGGPDLRTIYLGSLGGDRLECLRVPVAGLPPVHWDW